MPLSVLEYTSLSEFVYSYLSCSFFPDVLKNLDEMENNCVLYSSNALAYVN